MCDELEVAGCVNIDACNYDELATEDDGSCILIGDACDDGDDITVNDVIDENCECAGRSDLGLHRYCSLRFDSNATVEDGSCEYASVYFDCDGNCIVDEDEDGICDLIDPCVGTLDACGILQRAGAVYGCGCVDIPWGACDCEGNVEDECGVCGGDGIAADECDCDGNQLDALGVCGGHVPPMQTEMACATMWMGVWTRWRAILTTRTRWIVSFVDVRWTCTR